MRLDEAKNYTSGGALVEALRQESGALMLGLWADAATYLQAQTLLGEIRAAIPGEEARLTALEEDRARAAAALSDAEGRYAEALAARILAGRAGSQTYSDALQDLQHTDHARVELAGALRAAEGRVQDVERDLRHLRDHEAALQAVTYTGPKAIEILLRGETC